MNKAAGILFLSKKGTALFLRRAGSSDSVNADFPGHWDLPGGSKEGDETAEECALREAAEEIGDLPKGTMLFHTRTAGSAPKGVAGVGAPPVSLPVSEGAPAAALPEVDYTTFLQRVDDEFEPQLSREHDGHAWAPADAPPEPLHPGCRVALDRLAMNELGVARAIADGRLASPQRYENVWLFAIRITGTELAFRPKDKEFVHRDPAFYLNEDFLARCAGLPVVFKHPPSSLLNSEQFLDRIVGTVFLPYLAGAEVWAIAKIYVDEVAQMMAEGGLSTSPGVNFADWSVNRKLTLHLADGRKERVLFEGDPSLLDHVAICELGVWDKGDEPTGIRSESREDSAMADKEEDKAKDDGHRDDAKRDDKAKDDGHKKDAKKDGEEDKDKEEDKSKDDAKKDGGMGEVMDAIRTVADAVGHLGKRMDAYESRDDAKKDAKKDEGEDGDKDKAEETAADAKKKDAKKDAKKDDDEDKEKAKEDALAKKDSAALEGRIGKIDQRIDEVRRMIPKDMSDADFEAITDAQARADSVFLEFAQRAPRPLQGQTPMAYDRFVARKLQDHSPTWKGKDLGAITDEAFPIIRDQIFAEARQSANDPVNVTPGQLLEIKREENGHVIRDFKGRPSYWMNQFAGPVQMKGTGRFLHEDLGQQRRE